MENRFNKANLRVRFVQNNNLQMDYTVFGTNTDQPLKRLFKKIDKELQAKQLRKELRKRKRAKWWRTP